MPEVTAISFTPAEIATLLLKERDIHEGLWQLQIEFGLAGANAGPDSEHLSPAAMIAILKIGLTKIPDQVERTNLVIDAAVVNPRQ